MKKDLDEQRVHDQHPEEEGGGSGCSDPITPPPEDSAREAGLRYVSDENPGIGRRRRGKGFSYHNADGSGVSAGVKKRIESLVIPPAWEDVWISPTANGHIQATGRDEAGRKQYLYHEKWHEVREAAKFNRMIAFAEALPDIRQRIDHDLRLPKPTREKVLALILYILDATGIRIGNQMYEKENGSYGLTTLRKRHAEITSTRLHLEFTGKSGVEQVIDLQDRRVTRAIRSCSELPGYRLFKYIDDDGEQWDVDSADVNAYLCEIVGEGFTAKDFRTWRGTLLAARTLGEMIEAAAAEEKIDGTKDRSKDEANRADDKEKESKRLARMIVEGVKCVADELGNTPAVCRKHYIHPEVLRAFAEGEITGAFAPSGRIPKREREWLSDQEIGLLRFLRGLGEDG